MNVFEEAIFKRIYILITDLSIYTDELVIYAMNLLLFYLLASSTSFGVVIGDYESSLVSFDQELKNKVTDIFEESTLLHELFPLLQKSCVKDALHSFLPQCLINGFETVSNAMRMDTAVKLSLCQFEASGLENIPLECSYANDTENMMGCMLELETSNQWWTTYNGYYQNLPMFCVTNDPIFQKEQIIKTFMNVTRLVKEMNGDWDGKLKKYMENVDTSITQNLNNVETKFDETVKNVENMDLSLKEMSQEVEVTFQNTKKNFEEILKQNDEIVVKEFQSLQTIIENISNKIQEENLVKKLEESNNNSLELWTSLNGKLTQNKEELLKDQDEINSYVKDIKTSITSLDNEIGSLSQVYLDHLEANIQSQLDNINNQFISEWLSLTGILNKDIQFWNEIITDDFDMITKKLETTIEKVDYMEHKVNKLLRTFTTLNRLFGNCFKVVWNFLMNFREMVLFIFLFLLVKFLNLNVLFLKINKKIYCVLIVVGIISGNYIGFRLTSGKFFQPNIS